MVMQLQMFTQLARWLAITAAACGSFVAIPAAAQSTAPEVQAACAAARSLPNPAWTFEVIDKGLSEGATVHENPFPGRHEGEVWAERWLVQTPLFTCVPTNPDGEHPPGHEPVEVGVGLVRTPLGDELVCASGSPCPHVLQQAFAPAEDFAAPGPYATMSAVLPLPIGCTIFRPAVLSPNRERHPVVIWGNGTGATPATYSPYLHHLASHGFVVAAANTTFAGTGVAMTNCLNFLEQQSLPGGAYFMKLNLNKVGTNGHSQGAGGAIMVGRDARITTTVPFNGNAAGIGYQPGAQAQQHGPMLLFSSEFDIVVPRATGQQPLFDLANVPVFWATLLGADHFEASRMPGNAGRLRGPATAWLRYQLMLDEEGAKLFFDPDCTLCADPAWLVERKGYP